MVKKDENQKCLATKFVQIGWFEMDWPKLNPSFVSYPLKFRVCCDEIRIHLFLFDCQDGIHNPSETNKVVRCQKPSLTLCRAQLIQQFPFAFVTDRRYRYPLENLWNVLYTSNTDCLQDLVSLFHNREKGRFIIYFWKCDVLYLPNVEVSEPTSFKLIIHYTHIFRSRLVGQARGDLIYFV